MERKKSIEKNPWIHLTTVTKLDEGDKQWTTKCMDDTTEIRVGGKVINKVIPTTSLLIESLLQQLCTMLEERPSRRKMLYIAICDKLHEMKLIDSSYHIADFEMMRNHYQQALYHLVAVARSSIHKESISKVPNCFITDWSRYHQEFQEICFISSGGFGNVFRALNRLDGIEYAIKKIIVKSNRVKSVMQHLVEVKTIARLNHPNIVPYKAAWIEPTLESTSIERLCSETHDKMCQNSSPGVTSCPSKSYQSQCISCKERSFDHDQSNYGSTEVIRKLSVHRANSEDEKSSSNKRKLFEEAKHKLSRVVELTLSKKMIPQSKSSSCFPKFQLNSETLSLHSSPCQAVVEEVISHSVSFRNETEENDRMQSSWMGSEGRGIRASSSNSESDSDDECVEDRRICQYNRHVVRFSLIIIIEQLAKYIKISDTDKRQQYSTLYIQMALCDKTLRVWMDERVTATPQSVVAGIVMQILNGLDYIHSLDIVHHDIKPSNIFISSSGELQVQLGDFGLACPLQSVNHHFELGTPMYAAPEQLKGDCNPKSDIYSLGIVLIELLIPMQTCMECSRMVASLKSGHMPIELTATYPKWAIIVSRLIQKDPARRPSTSVLLEEIKTDNETTIAKLKHDNDKKSNIIEELQAKLAALEDENNRLKASLQSQ